MTVVRVATSVAWLCGLMISGVGGRAILGVDLGSLYMKVALVQSGSPIAIVTNMHSKRKTEQMILFDANQRFYGADAAALLARKSHTTPSAMSLMLGRDDTHPVIKVLAERHYPLVPVYNESRAGTIITVDGIQFTPEELVAMVLTHAVDISVAYAAEGGSTIAPPRDIVLTTPSFATMAERRALLDAAVLADMNVLTLIDENTAAALQYAMDKNFEEKEQLLLFYNMGASALQVSVIRFYNYEQPQKYGKPKSVPALEVLGKAWDATCGGEAFDHLLVEYLVDQFNMAWHKANPSAASKDVRSFPRAMTKLRIQANKIKHVLSANNEIPVYMDAVHDEVSLQTHMTRAQLEDLASVLLKRSVQPIHDALAAANKTIADLTGMELLGGGMRIPLVQQGLKTALGDALELGMHINSDESFALGAAFAGANISTAFRVRQVGMTDVNPFAIGVSLTDFPPSTEPKVDDTKEEWSKQANIFKSFGKMGVKKTIAFTHDRDIHCGLDYAASDLLPEGTELGLVRYNISGVVEFAKEMEDKGLGKPKVSLQFELSASGITSLIKAEAAVEETYTVQEEGEVDDDESTSNSTNSTVPLTNETIEENVTVLPTEENSNATEPELNVTDNKKANATKGTNATKVDKKPKKKMLVDKIFGFRRSSPAFITKEKKKIHKKALTVKTYYVGRVQPHSAELFAESRDKLLQLAVADKERMMLEEAKNKVESYIYKIKNMLSDDEETVGTVTTDQQREEVQKLAEAAEEWLYEDGYSADLVVMEEKYVELSEPFDKILLRINEATARPKAVEALTKKLTEVEGLMSQWEESKPQVTEEERKSVLKLVEEVRKWLEDKEAIQAKKEAHEVPVFLSSEIPPQTKPIEALIVRLNRKPKPKAEKKNETSTMNMTDTNSTANATGANETATESNTTSAANTTDAPAKADFEEPGSNETAETAEPATEGANNDTKESLLADEL